MADLPAGQMLEFEKFLIQISVFMAHLNARGIRNVIAPGNILLMNAGGIQK
jgi:hypothetical protein